VRGSQVAVPVVLAEEAISFAETADREHETRGKGQEGDECQ
jgi:hypothetical protein